jgi:hypothetical protein
VYGCLEELTIDCTKDDNTFKRDPFLHRFAPVVTFQAFQSLQKMTVLQQVLIIFDYNKWQDGDDDLSGILPRTLQHLQIVAFDGRILIWFENLSRVIDTYPHMRTVDLICRPYWGRSASWFQYNARAVFAMLEANNVQIKIVEDNDTAQMTGDEKVTV